jgi:hypothetical protein
MALNEVYETIEYFQRRAQERAWKEVKTLFENRNKTASIYYTNRTAMMAVISALAEVGVLDTKLYQRYWHFAQKVESHNIRVFLRRTERRERVD